MQSSESKKPTLIEGKVATILNAREIAITRGAKDGVKLGMKFKVMAKEAIKVHDPDSGQQLGEVDREKVRVEVVELQDKIAICKTYRTMTIGNVGMPGLNAMFMPRRTITETLKVEDASLPPPLSEEQSYVKLGDRVIQLIEGTDS